VVPGHAQITMTLDTYSNVLAGVQDNGNLA
jgi:hypothetical protein